MTTFAKIRYPKASGYRIKPPTVAFYIFTFAAAFVTLVPIVINLSMSPSDYSFEYSRSGDSAPSQSTRVMVDCRRAHFNRWAPNPKCNMYRDIDAKFLGGIRHLYKEPEYRRLPECSSCSPAYCEREDSPSWCSAPFDPEGVLSIVAWSLSPIILASNPTIEDIWFLIALGVSFLCYQLQIEAQNRPHHRIAIGWLVSSLALGVPGLIIHYTVIPLNKNIWSISYFLFTSGALGCALAFLYLAIDSPWRARILARLLQPFRWVGLNAILVYLGAATDLLDSFISCFYYDNPKNNLYSMFYSVVCSHAGSSQPPLSSSCQAGIMAGVSAKVALLLITVLRILFWIAVAGFLHWKKWYWAI